MKKMEKLKEVLPDPELFTVESDGGVVEQPSDFDDIDTLIVSWGSNKGVILDCLKSPELQGKNIGYLHYSYLWPLRTDRFVELEKIAPKTILIECNFQGQLGMLLKQETGIDFDERILKYDGRPFFYDELHHILQQHS